MPHPKEEMSRFTLFNKVWTLFSNHGSRGRVLEAPSPPWPRTRMAPRSLGTHARHAEGAGAKSLLAQDDTPNINEILDYVSYLVDLKVCSQMCLARTLMDPSNAATQKGALKARPMLKEARVVGSHWVKNLLAGPVGGLENQACKKRNL